MSKGRAINHVTLFNIIIFLVLVLVLVGGRSYAAPVDNGSVAIRGSLLSGGCTIDADSGVIDVALDPVELKELPAKGDVAKKTKFSIGLICDKGIEVSIMLSSGHEDSYGNGTLANISGDGQASGIGIQLLNDISRPVNFDQSWAAINTLSSGVNDINLYAQYIRTADDASAGKVNTVAEYTLSYQ